MRYTYDTEFLDDGRTIELISIGIVCEDGRTYYAVNASADWRRIMADKWLRENVVEPHIPTRTYHDIDGYWPALFHPDMKSKTRIAEEVLEFLRVGLTEPDMTQQRSKWEAAELWAWYSAHDHVALTQLWGPMVKAPWGVPMRTNCLKQHDLTLRRFGANFWKLPKQDPKTEHHALHDAHHDMDLAHAMGIIPRDYSVTS